MLSLDREKLSDLGLRLVKRLSPLSSVGKASYLVKNISDSDLLAEAYYVLKYDPDSHGVSSSFAFNAITASKANSRFLQPIEKLITCDTQYLAVYQYLPISLANIHDKKIALDHAQILKILRDMFQALRFLAQDYLKLSHNNLKLENILLDSPDLEKANLYLSDLSISELEHSTSTLSADLISIGYMIPKWLSPHSNVQTLGEALVFFENAPAEDQRNFSLLKELTLALIDLAHHQFSTSVEDLFTKLIPASFQSRSQLPTPTTPASAFLDLLNEDSVNHVHTNDSEILHSSEMKNSDDLVPSEQLNFMLLQYNQTPTEQLKFEMACLILKEQITEQTEYCIQYLKELAELRHAGACNLLAQCYLSGYAGLKDERTAFNLFLKGLSCDPDKETKETLTKNLVLCYQHGIGTSINLKEAEALL